MERVPADAESDAGGPGTAALDMKTRPGWIGLGQSQLGAYPKHFNLELGQNARSEQWYCPRMWATGESLLGTFG